MSFKHGALCNLFHKTLQENIKAHAIAWLCYQPIQLSQPTSTLYKLIRTFPPIYNVHSLVTLSIQRTLLLHLITLSLLRALSLLFRPLTSFDECRIASIPSDI